MNLGKVGIIFNGGGLTGFYSLGFVKALLAKGIKPDYVQSVSVGTLTASKLIAGNWTTEEAEKIWLKIQTIGPSSIFNRWEVPKNAARLKSSLYDDNGVMKLVIKNIDFRALVDSPIKYHIIVNNRNQKRFIALSNHDKIIKEEAEKKDYSRLEKIHLAAIGLYGFLPSILIDGNWYGDGMSFMLNEVIKARCDTIFILFNNCFKPTSLNYGELPFYQQFLSGFRDTVLRMEKDEIKYARSRGYDIIENNPSGYFDDTNPFHKKLRRRIKHLVDDAIEVAKSDSDMEDIFCPHRIVILTPPNPIPTAHMLGFKQSNPKTGYPGDISLGIEQCSNLPEEFWKKLE